MSTIKAKNHCKNNYGFKHHQFPQCLGFSDNNNITIKAGKVCLKMTDSELYHLCNCFKEARCKEQIH